MEMNRQWWHQRRVFLTGHTGFKGTWLSLWLQRLGAIVHGFALPPLPPSLYEATHAADGMTSTLGDILDMDALRSALAASRAEIVIHMAAQSLVRRSYAQPLETFGVNVMGTAHVLEAVRACNSVRAVLVVTSDKCYENREWVWGYRETDPMGGRDPYSASKGCAELVTAAYRQSFFGGEAAAAIATARAGNVIGGGDWAEDRLLPDMVRSFMAGEAVCIRNPHALRPWQHVLEPLRGYLMLAERLVEAGQEASGGWNFGPQGGDARSVAWVADAMVRRWGGTARWHGGDGIKPHEASLLALDCSKTLHQLKWKPVLDLDVALDWTVRWYRDFAGGADGRDLTMRDLDEYEALCLRKAGDT